MVFKEIWNGKLPSYWDMMPWFILINQKLLLCFRDSETGKRILRIVDVLGKEVFSESSSYNVILGTHSDLILLGHVINARSHIQFNRITLFNINTFTTQWINKEPILLEKFKLPLVREIRGTDLIIGNKSIDIVDGKSKTSCLNKNELVINNQRTLKQVGQQILCLFKGLEIWSIEGLFINWYHGCFQQHLYFLFPDNTFLIIDLENGNEVYRLFLKNLKTSTKRIYGHFEKFNDMSFDSTTIFDVCVKGNFIIWITNDNCIVINNTETNDILSINYPVSDDLYLSSWHDNNIILYAISDHNHGKLVLFNIEEALKNVCRIGQQKEKTCFISFWRN